MKIASMTSSFYSCRDREGKITYNESIRRLKAAGFEHIDLNLTSIGSDLNMFYADDWEQKAHLLREEAEKIGVKFVQSHAPFNPRRSFKQLSKEEELAFRERLMRGQKICEICGVPNVVIHAINRVDAMMEDIEAHVQYNYEFYDEFLNACDKAGMYACFENLPRGCTQYAAQLLEFMKAGKGHNVAVCWDFGHGQLLYPERTWSDASQADAIRSLKGHIRAVHVHDNSGNDDEHLLPFLGVVKWEEVLPALREAGFTGDLVYEIRQNAKMPYDLMDSSMLFCAEVGKKLIELFEGGN